MKEEDPDDQDMTDNEDSVEESDIRDMKFKLENIGNVTICFCFTSSTPIC
jgi:hypothetical protein